MEIVFAKLDQSEREIVLVVVGILADGTAEDFGCFGGVTHVNLDVSQQREEGIVLLAGGGNRLGGIERLMVETGAEVSIGQIEFHVVRLGIGRRSVLSQERAPAMRHGTIPIPTVNSLPAAIRIA